ncbi:MAG: MOSC domain-containing protein [Acidimicrobiales bacterium]
MPPSPCPSCRFDPDHLTLDDLHGTLRSLSYRWRWLAEGHDPAPIVELAARSLDAVGRLTKASVDGARTLDELADELDDRTRELSGRLALDDTSLAVAHDVTHDLTEAGRKLAADRPGRGSTGTVVGLFASAGGVPKLPIPEARIGYRGVEGDRQAARLHHGRVWQALCLWSADRVEALAAEGHPIALGNCGENISVRGIDWDDVRPGVRLGLGDRAVAEVSSYSPPCAKNARWFTDRTFSRIDHDLHPGWSRVYASVLTDGTLHAEDTVVLEP